MFFTLQIFSNISWNNFSILWKPFCCPWTAHKTIFPTALIYHWVGAINSMSFLLTFEEISFIRGLILILNWTFAFKHIIFPLSSKCKVFILIINPYLSFSLSFKLIEISLVNSFIVIISEFSTSMDHIIFPCSLIYITIVKNSFSMTSFFLKLINLALITKRLVIFMIFLLLKYYGGLFRGFYLWKINWNWWFKHNAVVIFSNLLKLRVREVLFIEFEFLCNQRVLKEKVFTYSDIKYFESLSFIKFVFNINRMNL